MDVELAALAERLTPAEREAVQIDMLRRYFGRRRREVFARNAGADQIVQAALRRRFRRVLDTGRRRTTATVPSHSWSR